MFKKICEAITVMLGIVFSYFIYESSIVVVPLGNRVSVNYYDGSYETIDGPSRLVQIFRTIKFLKLYTASDNQYISGQYYNGSVIQYPGPCYKWEDPLKIKNISILDSVKINANEAIIVYFKPKNNLTIQRKIIKGPSLFIPQPGEWIQQFSWHGSTGHSSQDAHSGQKVPRALNFNKLRLIPSNMYVTIPDVRSSDDAVVQVKMMLFYELTDIEKMLDSSNDPIGDFINSITSDVIAFVSKLSFENFKQNSFQLNNLTNFQQLSQRAIKIGYNIQKMVFRGYKSSHSLQDMTDRAIEARTRLLLESQTQMERENQLDMKLKREMSRQLEQQAMEKQAEMHNQSIIQIREEQGRQNQDKKFRQTLDQDKERQEQHLEENQQNLQIYIKKLQLMKDLGINLDQYFISLQKIDQFIKIDSEKSNMSTILGKNENPKIFLDLEK